MNEGKTKIIYELPNFEVLLQSKDRISANNAQRVNELAGKAAISNATASKVFEFLNLIGKYSLTYGKKSVCCGYRTNYFISREIDKMSLYIWH